MASKKTSSGTELLTVTITRNGDERTGDISYTSVITPHTALDSSPKTSPPFASFKEAIDRTAGALAAHEASLAEGVDPIEAAADNSDVGDMDALLAMLMAGGALDGDDDESDADL